ncbi:MFS transporter [Legionella yabuuchiae]|uniref:MFS transporter n=1 Tax=Legionella yabuuchiae TaxID=376727 RepID=UPI001056D5D3|nr:MFS transporter [Legionella yabuuchiae]
MEQHKNFPYLGSKYPGLANWILLIGMTLAVGIAVIDAVTVTMALPHIRSSLGLSLTASQWINTIEISCIAIFLIPCGRVADLFDTRRVWLYGALLYGIATLAAGLAFADWWIFLARALQGFGIALIIPATYAMIRKRFSLEQRGFAIGVLSSGLALCTFLAPYTTEWLMSHLGWRWIFFIMLPFLIVGSFLFVIASQRHDIEDNPLSLKRLDIPGTLLFAIFIISLQYTLLQAPTSGFGWIAISAVIVGVVSALGFWKVETNRADPMIDFSLFKNPVVTGALFAKCIGFYLTLGPFFYLLVYLQAVQGRSVSTIGLLLMVGSIGGLPAGLITGYLVSKIGSLIPLTVAALSVIASVLTLGFFLEPNSSIWWFILPLLLLTNTAAPAVDVVAQIVALNAVPKDIAGRVAATIGVAEKLWTSLGIAITPVLINLFIGSDLKTVVDGLHMTISSHGLSRIKAGVVSLTTPLADFGKSGGISQEAGIELVRDAFTRSLGHMMLVTACILTTAFIISFVLIRRGQSKSHQQEHEVKQI